mmetsp:Transcript_38997/g.67701  ORF Transcript_38997/g.67701 Transcript_38997/m.67701 type:complete len:208 (+) Transcript_38997:239-862(+)
MMGPFKTLGNGCIPKLGTLPRSRLWVLCELPNLVPVGRLVPLHNLSSTTLLSTGDAHAESRPLVLKLTLWRELPELVGASIIPCDHVLTTVLPVAAHGNDKIVQRTLDFSFGCQGPQLFQSTSLRPCDNVRAPATLSTCDSQDQSSVNVLNVAMSQRWWLIWRILDSDWETAQVFFHSFPSRGRRDWALISNFPQDRLVIDHHHLPL